jgi:hypothetical protein
MGEFTFDLVPFELFLLADPKSLTLVIEANEGG